MIILILIKYTFYFYQIQADTLTEEQIAGKIKGGLREQTKISIMAFVIGEVEIPRVKFNNREFEKQTL